MVLRETEMNYQCINHIVTTVIVCGKGDRNRSLKRSMASGVNCTFSSSSGNTNL